VVCANSQFATVFIVFFAKATGRTVRQIWTNDVPLNIGGKIPQKLKFWGRERQKPEQQKSKSL